ncbi:hypothetical protein [Lapidilactobacillus gannanensis]|jgi:hypothetical protein|uniref:Uncharacterized protein n=1 Tax=Lapidilactobacillus gannanensis TaxID=2486002 RepID=A0ABW4BNT2_9LACO|nr:hypothetical protein [Lapidilactobacillus gannanensis]MCH4056880.1 hypothetical protein [Lactobacillaceae bacterium]
MLATTKHSQQKNQPQDFQQLAHRIMILINTFLQPGEFHDPYNFRVKRYTLVYNTANQQLDLKAAWQIAADEQRLTTLHDLFQGHVTTDLHETEILQLLQAKLMPQLQALQ